MEQPVAPVKREIARHQIDRALHPERQAAKRAMAMIVEIGDRLAVGDVEEQHGAHHRQPDAQIAGEHRHEDPIGEIGDQALLVPPGPAGIAGR